MEREREIFIVEFGRNLKRVREEKRMTQSQLAADSNMEISQISRIERGVLNTSIGNVYVISRVLDLKIDEIFRFEK